MKTPTRLRYPLLEAKYNSANYQEVVNRIGNSDGWHARVWWDTAEQNFIDINELSE